jgi:hypothetical protein
MPVDGVENRKRNQRGFPSRLWARLRVHNGGAVHRLHATLAKRGTSKKSGNYGDYASGRVRSDPLDLTLRVKSASESAPRLALRVRPN